MSSDGVEHARSAASLGGSTAYDALAGIYDHWTDNESADIGFYLETALAHQGRVLEIGVGTGRVALELVRAGLHVVGIDTSEAMLFAARAKAAIVTLGENLELRHGTIAGLLSDEVFEIIVCAFNTVLHFSGAEKQAFLRQSFDRLTAGGVLAFDALTPSPTQIKATHNRRLKVVEGLYETPVWNEAEQQLLLRIEGPRIDTTLTHHWLTPAQWTELITAAGFNQPSVLSGARVGAASSRYFFRCVRPIREETRNA